jgi:hypothetical protein
VSQVRLSRPSSAQVLTAVKVAVSSAAELPPIQMSKVEASRTQSRSVGFQLAVTSDAEDPR